MKVNFIVSMMKKTMFDEEPLTDDVEANMINFCSVHHEEIDLGQLIRQTIIQRNMKTVTSRLPGMKF